MPLNENVTGPYLCPLTSVEWSSFKPAETWTKSCLLCCKQAVVSGCLVSRWTFLVEGDKVAGRPPRALLLFVGTSLGLNSLQIQCLVAVSGPAQKAYICRIRYSKLCSYQCLCLFAVRIPCTKPWWIQTDQKPYPGQSSLFRRPFQLQCVILACLRIVFLSERLEEWISGLPICMPWLKAKPLHVSKCVQKLFLVFCQCKVLCKDVYLE